MQPLFKTNEQRAMAYAAYKQLERMLKIDGDLPPGFYLDLTNKSIEIKFPKGTVVERDKGTNGDGSYFKKATQNLYGYAFWALLIIRLRKFNQWNAIRNAIVETLHEVVKRQSKNLREELIKEFPEVNKEIQSLEQTLDIPARFEPTPRICKDTPLWPTLTFKSPKV